MRCARAAVVVLSVALAVGTLTLRAAAQELRLPPDSILVLLASPMWPIRHVGLVALESLDTVPASVVARLRQVVAAEARAFQRVADSLLVANSDDERSGSGILNRLSV